MAEISASILAVEPENIEKTIKGMPSADYIHIDVMDGKFVKKKTIFLNPEIILEIKRLTKTPLDVHLMLVNPEKHIETFAKAGADILTFHYEANKNHSEPISLIKNYGIKAGIALNPDTELKEVEPYLKEADLILLMSVVPGEGGQDYIEDVTEKIRSLREIIRKNGYSTLIEVDGGIKVDNAYKPINAGADMLVSGTGIFSYENPDKAIRKMKEVILIGSDHGSIPK